MRKSERGMKKKDGKPMKGTQRSYEGEMKKSDEENWRDRKSGKKTRKRYEDLIKGIHDRRATRIDIGPESFKLTKLTETEDVEAFLTAFERAVEAHGVDSDKWAVLLAPPVLQNEK